MLTMMILMLSTLHSITLMMWYLMNKDCPDDLVDVVNLELDDFDDLDDVVDGQVQEHLVPVLVLLYRQGRESTSSFSGERIISLIHESLKCRLLFRIFHFSYCLLNC